MVWNRLLDVIYPPRCAACSRRGALLCAPCLTLCRPLPLEHRPRSMPVDSALDRVQGVFAFEGPIRAAIHAFKYRGERRMAEPLAALLLPHLPWKPDVLVPVPLHPDRLRERGFNQAAVLGQRLSMLWGVPFSEQLVRVRETAHQVGQTKVERALNVSGAFQWQGTANPPQRILLLDDVLTTGATLDACADALLAAGAVEVQGLALARAQA